MRKRALALFIVMLFVLPITSSFVTNPGGSNLQNVTQPTKESLLSYEEKEIKHLACGGSVDSGPFTDGDYWDTWVDDASYLEVDSSFYEAIYLDFNITETRPIGEFKFFLRWQVVLQGGGPVPTMYWRIYNYDTSTFDTVYSFVLGTTLNWEDREESITFDEKYVNATNHVRFIVSASTNYADDITVDYAYLTVTKAYDGEFRETLPDDVLYYPDSLRHTACDGPLDSDPFMSGDYWDTWEDDASYLTVDSSFSMGINLIFNITEYANFIVDNATLSIFLRWQVVMQGGGDNPQMYWAIWDFGDSSYDIVYSYSLTTTLNFENREESITFDEKYVNATNHVRFIVYSNSTYADDITVDYAYITATNDYTEPFSDVSDWTGTSWDAGESFTTDGDVGTFATEGDAASDSDYIYSNSINVSSADWDHIEMRYKVNSTDSYYWRMYILDADSSTLTEGRNTYNIPEYTSWGTYRWHRNDLIATIDDFNGDIESIHIRGRNDEDIDVELEIDYLRIGSSDEMGWQHDGSTISGLDDVSNGIVTSDGDEVTFTANAGEYGWIEIWPDRTSTATMINTNYYPFLEFSVTEATTDWYLRADWSDASSTSLHALNDDTGIFRYNLRSISGGKDLKKCYFRVQNDNGKNVTFDYLKYYSIANYTVTESSTTTDDVLYVEDGILHSYMDAGSFILDYAPTFLLEGSNTWTKYTTLGESYLSYNHGGWTDYSNETTGDLHAGISLTITGLRIKFNETANIQKIEYSVLPPQWTLVSTAIIYFDTPNWWVIGIAGAVFYIPIGEFTLQLLMMIMGLVMIPFSTLFLVKGGRDEMDRDKLYFFLLMFLIGWALFLGGIL